MFAVTFTNAKTISKVRHLLAMVIVCVSSQAAFAGPGGYKKATEGDDVVKDKMYPKKGKVELNVPNLGLILNQSYVDSYVINGGINYFRNEVWGFGVDATYAMNQDRAERKCIENFYNKNPSNPPSSECGSPDNLTQGSTMGPAYANIREYNYLIAGSVIWNPIYGKEIFFLSAVGHFDLFVNAGGGMAFSTFYPQTTTLKNGNQSRGGTYTDGSSTAPAGYGAGGDETDSYDKAGRPAAQSQSNPFIHASLGQKFHFAQKFHVNVELRDHFVIGTSSGFDMFFTLWGGLGMRF